MKPIYKAWFGMIEITNHCFNRCLYCSRYERHIRPDQKFNMSLEVLEKALVSYEGFKSRIGFIGGEPTIHPQFEECCKLARKIYPKGKLGILTTGGKKYQQYKKLIEETFSYIAYNEHTEEQKRVCVHQPITVAIQDVVDDEKLRNKLIDDCWVQRTWCPTISPKGCFFCEIAYGIDSILDGPGGYPIEPGWWKKTPEQFKDQVDRYCKYCGMCVPMERELTCKKTQKFSHGLYEEFKKRNLPGIKDDEIEFFDGKVTIESIRNIYKKWYPGNYRIDKHDDTKCKEQRGVSWNPEKW